MSTVQLDPATQTVTAGTSTAPTAAPVEPVASNEREYVLLKRLAPASPGSQQTYESIGIVTASSPEQAVRRAAENEDAKWLNAEGPTTVVAVPTRSFSPVTVGVEVTRKVTLS